jgi:hypothetical protein
MANQLSYFNGEEIFIFYTHPKQSYYLVSHSEDGTRKFKVNEEQIQWKNQEDSETSA